jgi:transcription antitermination protein NusB
MISRRNIRVKVMQTLYSVETTEPPIGIEKAQKMLENQFDLSRRLFTYLVYFIGEVARYAEKDSRARASKHLPTEQDLDVNVKIAGNSLLWQLLEAPGYGKSREDHHVSQLDNPEMTRRIYNQLTATAEYKEYISKQSRDKKEEKAIIELIFNQLMLPSDDFISWIEEHFISWDDDAEMMQQMMQNFFHKPSSYQFDQLISAEKLKFGRDLLKTAIEKREYCLELIKPKLKNWDSERIAVLDMILMRLGVAELLYFETIPTKVTINEYIDLAKDYSTTQSGQFVNGILDSIHKDLEQGGKLVKVDYKKQ